MAKHGWLETTHWGSRLVCWLSMLLVVTVLYTYEELILLSLRCPRSRWGEVVEEHEL